MSTKAEQAITFHDKGYNCAQAVACSFCKEFGVDEEEMFRIAEGFGLGMGMMEVCGALSGMMMIIGLQNSVGNPEKGKMTKGDTYKKVREYTAKFKEQNGSYLCKELKGVETGKVLRSCPDCIRDAVALTEEYLAAQQYIKLFRYFYKLTVVQILVESAFCHKVVMRTLFDDTSVFHNKNFIGIADCGETMCNDKTGTSFHKTVKCLLDHKLCSGIDA